MEFRKGPCSPGERRPPTHMKDIHSTLLRLMSSPMKLLVFILFKTRYVISLPTYIALYGLTYNV
jgi:hypothetical protein